MPNSNPATNTIPKIFGVGLPRTGTTSLSLALNSLGIPTLHGAYKTFPGVLDLSHPIYQQFQAFVDTPFYLLFDEFNAHHPDCKFILTTRALDNWLASCATLWDYKTSVFSQNHPVWLYAAMTFGTHSYNTRRFAEVYLQHRECVDRFFASLDKNRCLTLNLDEVDSLWHLLATFLQVPEPAVQYPHSNTSRQLRQQLATIPLVSSLDAASTSTPDCSTLVRQFEHWTVSHSLDLRSLGYLIVSSRSGSATLTDLSDGPRSELGHVLAWACSAVRRLTVPEQVYVLLLGEHSSNLHFHIVPRPRFIRENGASFFINLKEENYQTRFPSVAHLLRELRALP
jgi:diadenosine tetraphosphate (Ap4A) HIT family hydrolase